MDSGGGSKFIISRDITFDETRMGMKCKDSDIVVPKKAMEETQFEVELPEEEDVDVDDQISTSSPSETQPMVDPDYLLARYRERSTIVAPRRYGYVDLVSYALNAAEELQDSDPRTFKEALESKDNKEWLKEVKGEISSLETNHTWELVKLPKTHRVVGCKWIFKKREGIPGVEGSRYKARLVAKGFTQFEGIDYNEIFFPE